MRDIRVLLTGLGLAILASCSSHAPLSFVDTSIGSGGHGHVFVGASVPFGMVQVGPISISRGWDWCSGYHISDSSVVGFAHTHLSGTGVGDLGDVIILPVTGNNQEWTRSGLADKADRSKEIKTPTYYSVPLERSGVLAEMSATQRTAIHRYTFPSDAENPALVFDLANGCGNEHTTDAGITIVSPREITGYRYSAGWAKDQRLYFAAEFSEDISVDSVALNYWKMNLREGVRQIMVKVALSPTSEDAAYINLKSEIPDWNINKVIRNGKRAWNRELGKIHIKTSSDPAIFYTALYHTMIEPALFSDFGKPNRYTVFSLWDTYRAQMPLFTIIHPEKEADVINSFLDIYDKQGTLPTWHLWGNETNCMIGKPGVMVTADAILKGFTGFDKEKAVDAVRETALKSDRAQPRRMKYGYLPCDVQKESVAWEMEYCIADNSAYQVTGDEFFLQRSKSYKIHFDPQTGFMRGIDTLKHFREPFNPYSSEHRSDDYCEGNAWQYIWLVPQDVEGLVECFGSKERMLEKLDSLFIVRSNIDGKEASADITGLIGQYAHGNEPSHHIAYIYAMLGQQEKTTDLVRKICTELYRHDPDGLCGNEDCGQMSAWYVLSMLGFYQVEPSVGRFWFGCPQLKEAVIKLPGGKRFIIKTTPGRYIDKIELNGIEYNFPYISYEDIMKGGRLEFQMKNE